MSIEIQKNIKDNSRSVSEYFGDLLKWEEEENKKEQRREAKKAGVKPSTAKKVNVPPPRGSDDTSGEIGDNAIARDKLPMPKYYHDWDQFDADEEVEKLELQEEEEVRREKDIRQAERDRILDEMTFSGDGDRIRTTKARPRVKINIRAAGRRPAPVDLARPKKEEANNYFAQGRFKEAMVAYSTALDYLEKYEPPGRQAKEDADGNVSAESAADGAGQESEAIELKVTLLANRAQALIKVEEWREAIGDCDEALQFDPNHHKATLRRGFALAKQKRWGLAARDLERAVAHDPKDKKAAAELQMAKRNLAEQAKEVRVHAKKIMSDTTREPTMPTRKLTVKVRRPGSAYETADDSSAAKATSSQAQPQPKGMRGEAQVLAELDSDKPLSAGPSVKASEPSTSSSAKPRQPYVPRSVRIRGRQPEPETISMASQPSAPSTSEATPAINFYAFEAQWARLQKKPAERFALLKRVGAAALPSLFRESLDAELVGSIISVLFAEISSESAEMISFASAILDSLSKTQRFQASCEALSSEECRTCQELLMVLEKWPQHCTQDLDALRRAFEPAPMLPRLPGQEDDDEEDEDDVYIPQSVTSSAPVAEDLSSAPEPVGGVAAISLDDCD